MFHSYLHEIWRDWTTVAALNFSRSLLLWRQNTTGRGEAVFHHWINGTRRDLSLPRNIKTQGLGYKLRGQLWIHWRLLALQNIYTHITQKHANTHTNSNDHDDDDLVFWFVSTGWGSIPRALLTVTKAKPRPQNHSKQTHPEKDQQFFPTNLYFLFFFYRPSNMNRCDGEWLSKMKLVSCRYKER